MATIQSNFPRFLTSVQPSRATTGALVTPVTPIRPPANRLPMPRSGVLFTLPKEPEDARITGGTRSLDRRLLALNLAGSIVRVATTNVAAVPKRIGAAPRSAA